MCGICGVYSLKTISETDLLAPIQSMTALMARRGPDDEGFWHDNRCGFGFRRLAILDLSPTGHQPMMTADGRYVIVFNGEVYNFQDIRPRLESRGVRFRSTGDTEVILYALAEWGIAALNLFNGMFALAFYDTVTHRLILARDHAGIKPLYYLHTARCLLFASQYNQLLHHPWSQELEISQTALSLYLRFGYIPAPYGMLSNTHSLDAGSWLSIGAEGKIEQGYFYKFPPFSPSRLQGIEAVEALEEALTRAISRHLISDVPVGVFLSGGIDSPLVAAEATHRNGSRVKAFTIGVPDREMDESRDACHYAAELEVEHILRMANQQAALDLLDDVIEACSEPTADYSIFPTLLVSQLAAEQVKVVLSGDGGDELFWGYPSRFGAVIEQAKYYDQPFLMRYISIAARRYLKQGQATRDVLWPTIGRFYQKKHTIMLEPDLQATFPNLSALPTDLDLFDYDDTEPDKLAQWLRWNEFRLHLARILLKVDRASMHHSLEVRVPLLDKEVIAVALQTEWRSCLNVANREGKIPLRELLGRRLHHQTSAKKGFTVPMHQWLAGPLQTLLQEKLLHRPDFLGQAVNQSHLQRMNQELLRGNRYKAWGLWLLLSLALWEEKHLCV